MAGTSVNGITDSLSRRATVFHVGLAAWDDAATDLAVRASLTGDRRIGGDYLDARPEKMRRCRIGSDLFDWLAQHGGLTAMRASSMGS
ncbi:hypothetical protein [Micromonospora sp. NPDC023633]|uniref:hypothetical protein n=1 Tax=Micromonospora sp. NPDC023633 TaxID=3154320 RepID=UPI0033CC44F0